VADGHDDSVARLERWAADARVGRESRRRRTRRDLHDVAASDSTVEGLLVDRAERGDAVAITTVTGSTHRGRVVATTPDAVVLETPALTIVAMNAVATVAGDHGSPAVASPRRATADLGMESMVAALAGEGARVRISHGGDGRTSGRLQGVGDGTATLIADDGSYTVVVVERVVDVVILDR